MILLQVGEEGQSCDDRITENEVNNNNMVVNGDRTLEQVQHRKAQLGWLP